jgi:hypothetical protein
VHYPFVATLHDGETLIVWDRHLGQVADAVIEAEYFDSTISLEPGHARRQLRQDPIFSANRWHYASKKPYFW